MSKKSNPHKLVASVILGVLYTMLSISLLFVAVPVWLREADTVVNILALLAVLAWCVLTFYIVHAWRSPKPTRKRKSR